MFPHLKGPIVLEIENKEFSFFKELSLNLCDSQLGRATARFLWVFVQGLPKVLLVQGVFKVVLIQDLSKMSWFKDYLNQFQDIF